MPPRLPSDPYGPDAPTITADKITVSVYLNDPVRVNKSVSNMVYQRFIADVIFDTGPQIPGGVLLYDQVDVNDLFLKDDVQEIEPGMQFPLLTSEETVPLVALAKKYGGEVFLTYEDVRRNRRDKLNREMQRLRNTIIRRVDALAIAHLRTAPINQMAAAGNWSAIPANDIVGDFIDAMGLIDDLDLGYTADTVLINPAQLRALLKNKDIREELKTPSDIPLRTGKIGRWLNMDFVASNRVAPGEVFVLQRKIVGGLSDEIPAYAKVIDSERDERYYLHGARPTAPYVTDPKAVTRISGAGG